jgi:hypothetical protein
LPRLVTIKCSIAYALAFEIISTACSAKEYVAAQMSPPIETGNYRSVDNPETPNALHP